MLDGVTLGCSVGALLGDTVGAMLICYYYNT
jgi:hypothetical protein